MAVVTIIVKPDELPGIIMNYVYNKIKPYEVHYQNRTSALWWQVNVLRYIWNIIFHNTTC